MRVSVIIPAYNEEALIHRTLDSLRNQDYRGEMEIIVVDNQCTDGTVRIAKEWGVRVVREERKGYVYALMCGFEHTSGEIVITTDADTFVPQNWVSTLVCAFDQDPQVVAAGGMVEFYDGNWQGNLYARCVLPIALACERLCFNYPHLWGANMAVRREAFLKAGGWSGKINLQADTDLSRRLARIGKVIMIKSLKVSTSARRFNHGLLVNLFVYGVNFLGLQLFHRPVFFEFKAVRSVASNATEGRPSRYKKWPVFYVIALAVVLSGSGERIEARPAGHSSGSYIKRIATHDKVIALTFDDGPNEPYTSQVLKILQANDVRATFFLIGKNVMCFPGVAREIVQEGHAVANHSYSHPFFLALEPSKYQGRQIDVNEQILESVTGVHCTLFRPPHGFHSPWLLRAAAKRGLTAVGWSEDGRDWHNVTSAQIADRIVRHARPGNIILLHDGLNVAHQADRSKTVNALPAIIATLKAQGYRFVTIPELLAGAAPRPPR